MAKPQPKGKISIKQKVPVKGKRSASSRESADSAGSKHTSAGSKQHESHKPTKLAKPIKSKTTEPEFSDDTDSGIDEDDELGVQGAQSSDEESQDSEISGSDKDGMENSDQSDEEIEEDDSKHSEINDQGSENEGEDSESEFPMRKKKKTTDDGRQTFASAFNAIMGSKLKAYDRKDPILARNKSVSKELESHKLEARAKRALHTEKMELLNKYHVTELLPSASEPEKVRAYLDKEKALKKIAQRGVVKLFNAVMSSQALVSDEMEHEHAGPQRKNELLTEVTKSTFLDMVKAAGEKE